MLEDQQGWCNIGYVYVMYMIYIFLYFDDNHGENLVNIP